MLIVVLTLLLKLVLIKKDASCFRNGIGAFARVLPLLLPLMLESGQPLYLGGMLSLGQLLDLYLY
jgi:hypothetical protein